MLRRLIAWPNDRPIRAAAIAKRGWSGLTSAEVVKETLELLAESGWVQAIEAKPTKLGGRPTTNWIVHPQAAKFMEGYDKQAPETPKTHTDGSFGGFDGTGLGQSSENGSVGGEDIVV